MRIIRVHPIATSGDDAHYFEEDGRKFPCTIDPTTKSPVSHNMTSITVIHRSGATADGWATALNILGPEAGYSLALRQQLPVVMILGDTNGFRTKMTPEFATLINAAAP
jgi:FAD:protein FMN transferase